MSARRFFFHQVEKKNPIFSYRIVQFKPMKGLKPNPDLTKIVHVFFVLFTDQ